VRIQKCCALSGYLFDYLFTTKLANFIIDKMQTYDVEKVQSVL